ncbi:MAG: ABC transporter ATP-binding protein [Betaproteobacteria bacterium]|jgi:oligopeptide/dipeptide ABC transporter ATP-binding protein|nr:ABC transporter ATP-binding protein [Betaproteobacteria bacterium]NBT09690.1 ABC transporter ATP-binding protein [Betaproteobacteria bacterium]NBU49635.1 ABC transporter ATP-binding protein [Betaproteobacteria bacterium]
MTHTPTSAVATAVATDGAALHAGTASDPILRVERLHKRFPVSGARGSSLHAVDDVSLDIGRGESVGLVGESGCGKSTLVRLLARLHDASEGRILFDGQDLSEIPALRFARSPWRSAIQMVFQDPTDSLNPRYTARDTIAEPLKLLTTLTREQEQSRVQALAEQVGLPAELLDRYPHQLSGGQKARVGIARALAVQPRLLILDEPTAALDVSVQAVVLQLLQRLRQELGLSCLFVSHDLNVVRLLTDRVAVMYLGRIVEVGPSEAVFRHPRHPYTKALVSSIPGQGPRIKLSGEVASPIDPPSQVCRLHGRCPIGQDVCARQMPLLRAIGDDVNHRAACHFIDPA